jgi:hypothetical protein
MLTIMRRLEAIDLSRPAALLRLPQPGRSCQTDIALAVSTTIDPLAGDRGFESTSLQQRVRCELDLRGRSRPAQRHDRRSVPHRLEVVRQAEPGVFAEAAEGRG